MGIGNHQDPAHGCRKALWGRLAQETRPAAQDCFPGAAAVAGDHSSAARHGLQGHDAEVLVGGGVQQGGTGCQQGGTLLVAEGGQEPDLGTEPAVIVIRDFVIVRRYGGWLQSRRWV